MATYQSTHTGAEIDAGIDLLNNNSATEGQVLMANGKGKSSWQNASGGAQLYMHSISLLPGATSSGTVFSFTIFSYSNLEYNNQTISEYVKNHGDEINVPGFIGDSDNHYPITRLMTSYNNLYIYYFTETGELSFELFNTDVIVDEDMTIKKPSGVQVNRNSIEKE